MHVEDDNPKNHLHKLLKEFEANRGMAGMVCGRPIELMPPEDQERIFTGFCTAENMKILAISREKLLLTEKLELTESEQLKVGKATRTLEALLDAFNSFISSTIDRETLRQKVQKILEVPIPTSEEDLTDSLSTLIETLLFLSTQTLHGKDDWDRMIDCVQLHDALQRTIKVCNALQRNKSEETEYEKQGESISDTLIFCKKHIETLEAYFRGEFPASYLQPFFGELFTDLNRVWGEGGETT